MPPTPSPSRSPDRPATRWWPALAVVALAVLALVANQLRPAEGQSRVLAGFAVVAVAGFLLLLWMLFLSRWPRRRRLGTFAAVVALGVLASALFEIRGVRGDLMPIVGWRWGGERGYGLADRAADAAIDLEASPPGDYPQFLGPERDATLPGPRLERDWLAEPPREVWRRRVGEGWSAFAVAGDAAVTQEQRGDSEAVVRYDLETGEQVWAQLTPGRFEKTIGGIGPRATPTLSAGRVFALGARGLLSALDLETGALLWSADVIAEAGAAVPEWGKSCSPLVLGERVIVSAGGPGGDSLVAYHRETGVRLWGGGSDASGYSSPLLAELAGEPQVLILNQASVAAHAPGDGRLLWSWPWSALQPNVAQPVPVGGDRLLVSSGYGIGTSLLQVKRETEGGFRVEELWRSPRLKAKFANFVVHEGTIYGLDDGILTALDLETGERLWKRGRYGHGQLILVGELIVLQAENGDVVLLEPSPEEHRELGSFSAFGSKTWNSPALAGRYLLVRNDREAACYELPVEG